MPTSTYTALATVTLGGTASSVTFSSIPATYRDLILVGTGTISGAVGSIRFNADTGSNYTRVGMLGNGSSTSSFADTSAEVFLNNSPMTGILQIMDYSATDKHKTYLHRDNNASSLVVAQAGRWANTAAITTVGIVAVGGTFSAGVTFALYGIAS